MTEKYPRDPIEYLVKRRFGDYQWLKPQPLTRTPTRRLSPEEQQRRARLLQEIEAYRESLRSKPLEDRMRLVEDEQRKENEEQQAKAAADEKGRFFNQPDAVADFDHWSKAPYWSLDEAIALTFGKAPELVSWENIVLYARESPFVQQYGRVRDLAFRGVRAKQLTDPTTPGAFIAWARRTEIAVPDELVKAVEARGIPIADWKTWYDELKERYDALTASHQEQVEAAHSAREESDGLQRRIAELEASAWEFDPEEATYPVELDIAMQAWRFVSKNRDPSMTVKRQLSLWLGKTFPKLSAVARERIVTICNWEKRGGRRPQNRKG